MRCFFLDECCAIALFVLRKKVRLRGGTSWGDRELRRNGSLSGSYPAVILFLFHLHHSTGDSMFAVLSCDFF